MEVLERVEIALLPSSSPAPTAIFMARRSWKCRIHSHYITKKRRTVTVPGANRSEMHIELRERKVFCTKKK
jgi:hypothetical protein